MLAETVERRATTGWGEAAAKAAVFSASRLKGLVVPLALAVVWEAVARTGAIPVYLLPAPSEVFAELAAPVENGELWQHVAVTVRSEDRRVGKECVSQGRTRGSP